MPSPSPPPRQRLREAKAFVARLRHLRRAARLARAQRANVGAILMITLATAGLGSLEPLVLKTIFDGLAGPTVGSVVRGVAVLAGLGILRELGSAASNWLTWRTRLAIHFLLLEQTVERLHRMPLRMQRSEGVGAILTRLDRGIQGFLTALTQLLFDVLPALLYLVLSFAIMLRLDARLAALVLAFVPLPLVIATLAAPRQIDRERSLVERWARIYSRFNEVLSGLVTVRSFAMEDAEKARFLRDVREANRVVVRGVGVDTGFGAASNLAVTTARIVAIGAGSALLFRGEITIGTLVAFIGYLAALFGPVQGLAGVFQSLQKASVSLDQIFSILDLQEHLGDAPDAVALERVEGRVEFRDVCFGYEAMATPILDGFSLAAEPGETVALVGSSGSGKSTAMALLMRFYDPQEGVVRIDGRDLRSITQRSLRQHIGVVLQEPVLFNDSIRNNIAYGRPEATLTEIEAAARAARADAFIARLPDGYETVVGERGALLSVGERQRIAIARVLVKDPRIVVLDEPTAALDPETEADVQRSLEEMMVGRTCFVIAHRLSTVVRADRIAVLAGGRVVESGSHRVLLARSERYAALVRQQVGPLLGEEAFAGPGAGLAGRGSRSE